MSNSYLKSFALYFLFQFGIFLIGINAVQAQNIDDLSNQNILFSNKAIPISNNLIPTMSMAGKIYLPNKNELKYRVESSDQGTIVNYQSRTFKGSTLFDLGNCMLSVDANYENAPSTFYFYSNQNELLFQKKFKQSINILFSENKNYVGFYDGSEIVVLNCKTFDEQKYSGSIYFFINNDGIPLVLEPNEQCVYFKNQLYKKTLHAITNLNTAEVVYQSNDKVVFDLYADDAKLYWSTRQRQNDAFVFELMSTSSFNEIKKEDEKSYSLEKFEAKSPTSHKSSQVRDNEWIRNPIDFVNDSSYQAIGNSYNEIQEYSPGSTYLHPGVDLFGDHLENVHSIHHGYVKAILTTSGDYHWRIAIANENTSDSSQGYLYAHLDKNLIPYLVGDSLSLGNVIGQLVDFPVTGFVHCHFARIVDSGATWTGSWWTFDDPLYYMENFLDNTYPTFQEVFPGLKFAFREPNGDNYLVSNVVEGSVDIVSKVYDEINTFWKVDVHKIGYEIYPVGNPNSKIVKSDAYDFNMFNDTYFNGPYIQTIIETMYARDASCMSTGNYNDREFFHVLTNSNGDDTIANNEIDYNFNSTLYPNGNYVLKVWAVDAAGNLSADSMQFTIDNFVGINSQKQNDLKIYPNPTKGTIFIHSSSNTMLNNESFNIYSSDGRLVQSGTISNNQIDVSSLVNGFYVLKIGALTEKIVLNY